MNVQSSGVSQNNILDRIQSFHDTSQYLKAWALSQSIGPLKQWRGAREMVLAGRLAFNLGSRRLGNVMHRLALRMYPNDPTAVCFAMLTMSNRLGPWESLRRMKLHGDLSNAPVEIQSDWLSLKALNYSQLRDFQKAEYWQAKAFELTPESAWLYVSLTSILEYQDRNDEATAAAEQAIAIRPNYRPAIQSLANRYIESNRDEDAVGLLGRACNEVESGLIRCQLASFYRELEQYEKALKLYDGIELYFPLMSEDAKFEKWLASVEADLYHLAGKREEAAKRAKVADDPFYDSFAQRLTNAQFNGKRLQLPVRYFKQHNVTCAPATLTALTDYWKKEVQHLDIVEKICYDGTPSYSERRWAAQNGFKTVEFTVTWETATALLDNGLPFTLTTIEPGNGHLQPIIGYDSFRKTLITRDPGNRHANEFVVDKMLERYASTGPRGMALVPIENANLLESITFVDAKEYDLLFNVELCLEKHQRDKANDIVALMEQHFSDHRLTLRARSCVARYDADMQAILQTTSRMLEKYPDDVNLQLQKLSCLNDLGRREDRVTELRSVRNSDNCHPIFWSSLAAELADDARERGEVKYLLNRSIRFRYFDGYGFYLLANLLNDEGQREEALELYRIAACLDQRNEHRARSYFYAAQSLNRSSEAIELLQDRIERFGKKSSAPATTVAIAFDEMDQTEKAFGVFEEAHQWHEKDGSFLLSYADFCSRYGRAEKATALLAEAKPHVSQQQWLQYASTHATQIGDLDLALKYLQEIIAADPLAYGAHHRAAQLIANRDGKAAVIERMRRYVEKFPKSYPLGKMLIEWISNAPAEVREVELLKFLQIHAGDAWALRELASVLADQKRFTEAAATIEAACVVDPNSPATHGFRGEIYKKQNRLAEAIVSYRQALLISVDYEFAIHELIDSCQNRSQRVEQLLFVFEQLNSQVNRGDGLLRYREYAKQVLGPESLLKSLVEMLDRRSDLWQAWIALSRQLSDMQQHDQAINIAKTATDRFPLLPRVWLELAAAYANCGKRDQQIESLEKASQINQNWGEVILALSEAYDKKGDLVLAREQIEKALKLAPNNAVNHGYLADLLWRHGDRQQALESIARAVELDPDYEFAWSALRAWCEALGQPDFDVEVAVKLTRIRPNDAGLWQKLAFCLDQPHQIEDAIDALDRALALEPRLVSAIEQKVTLLCSLGRFDEARQVLATDAFAENYPTALLARKATIRADEGDTAGAVEEMLSVVESDPDYFHAWQQIADWATSLELVELQMRAGKNMTRLEPQYHIAWGYLAEACMRQGDRAAAKTHLFQAIQLAPDYTYASGNLLDMQLEDGEFDEAIAVVDCVAPHVSEVAKFTKLIEIESKRIDRNAAFNHFDNLCTLDTEDVESVSNAAEMLCESGWSAKTLDTLSKLADSSDVTAAVADAFALTAVRMKQWDLLESTMHKLRPDRDVWDQCVCRYLTELQNAGEMERFWQFVKCSREFIRETIDGWQNLSWLFVRMSMYGHCIEWMFDWKVREQVETWSLLNLTTSYFCTNQDEECLEVCRAALSNRNCDAALAGHLKVMLGFHQLVYFDLDDAFETLTTVDADRLPSFYQVVFYQAMVTLEAIRNETSLSTVKSELASITSNLDPSLEPDRETLTRNQDLILWSLAKRQGKSIKAALLKRKAKIS